MRFQSLMLRACAGVAVSADPLADVRTPAGVGFVQTGGEVYRQ